MDAADVWEDAQQIASILQHNQSKAEPIVRLQIPLSVFVSALDQFDKDELMIVRQRIDERLAAQQRHRADRDHPQKHQPLH